MEISNRLKTVALMVDKCEKIVDVGTDHAYIPIYLLNKGLCKYAIASDINKGPIDKAKINIVRENLDKNIECRLGPGLTTVSPKEVQGAIIAGMGGHMIKDILEESKDVFKSLDFLVLQPVQNPDALRCYLYKNGYEIIEEQLAVDENRFYEIIKIKYDKIRVPIEDDIYYEIGKDLIDKKHPLLKRFLNHKIDVNLKILNNITQDTEGAMLRKRELKVKIQKLRELL
ncbi:class I SAM-dependent methyltransferase [Clostridium oceanicum]|uniref:Class I SAM-dependent methyltransferase n=1 Tax=Clostridium oceanicum TaxID=1543 RepID=A0ABN1JVG7_9CLOT